MPTARRCVTSVSLLVVVGAASSCGAPTGLDHSAAEGDPCGYAQAHDVAAWRASSCADSTVDYDGKKIWAVGDSIVTGVGALYPPPGGGCGWRDQLQLSFAASGMAPIFVGGQSGGYGVSTCPMSGLPLAHEGHNGLTCADINAGLSAWFTSIGGSFDVGILECGTNDLIADQANGTNLAAEQFDAAVSAFVALRPEARFFVSDLPPSPGISRYTGPFAMHVAARVSSMAAEGTKVELLDHYAGVTPDAASTPIPSLGFSGGVHPTGSIPGGYEAMARITYMTLTHATP